MSALYMLIRRAGELPAPTEAEAAGFIAPNKVFDLGCMFAQVIVDTFFAGVMAMQVLSYFKYQRNDKLWTKLVVVAACTINGIITCYLWYFGQYLFVAKFGLFAPFFETGKLAWFPLLDSINSGIIQSFFAYRAYRLCNRNIFIPIIVGLLIVASFSATVAVKVMFAALNSELEAAVVKIPELIWLSSIMAADVIITVSILYGLLKSKTGWAHTDKTISRLIRMTLESQVPPTIIAIIFMAEFVNQSNSLFGATLQGIQSKFYGMGLMYALNSRVKFQQHYVGDGDKSNALVFGMATRPGQKTDIQVEIETETHVGPYGDTAYTSEPKDLESFSGENINNLAYNSKTNITNGQSQF